MNAPLRTLVAAMDAAVAAPVAALPAMVRAALGECLASPDWLTPEQCRASHDHYTRHVLHGDADGRYTIVAIVWGTEQRSPIHAHHTWCGVGVYRGEITEGLYREDTATGTPMLVNTTSRRPGSLSFDPSNGGIHSIANTAREPAISIHAYGIAPAHITTGVNRVLGWA